MDAFSVFDVSALVNVDEITKFHSQVVTSDLVHLNATFLNIIRAQANEHCVASLFAAIDVFSIKMKRKRVKDLPNNDCITSEK